MLLDLNKQTNKKIKNKNKKKEKRKRNKTFQNVKEEVKLSLFKKTRSYGQKI